MTLKKDLIRLGSVRPELRKHLRPILAEMERTSKLRVDMVATTRGPADKETQAVLKRLPSKLIQGYKSYARSWGFEDLSDESIAGLLADDGFDIYELSSGGKSLFVVSSPQDGGLDVYGKSGFLKRRDLGEDVWEHVQELTYSSKLRRVQERELEEAVLEKGL